MPADQEIGDEIVKKIGATTEALLVTGNANAQDSSQAVKKLLVAVSGGPDSTALLFALGRFREQLNWILEAAHVNHHLRGTESDQDQAFCQSICDRLKINLHVHQDFPDSSNTTKGNSQSEEALRMRRYEFLDNLALDLGASALVTAHTLNDQVETVIFRLIRGTSLSGVRGIQAARLLPSGILLLRPMLSLTKDEICSFLTNQGIEIRNDSSNSNTNYSRNFIRRSLMQPLLERFPGFLLRIERFTKSAAADDEFLTQIATEWFARLNLEADIWDTTTFSQAHTAIVNRLLAMGLHQRGIEVSHDKIELLLRLLQETAGKTRISFNENWDLKKAGHRWQWLNKSAIEGEQIDYPHPFEIKLRIPGTTLLSPLSKAIAIERIDRLPANFPADNSLEAIADLAWCDQPLVMRRRLPGDFIQPFGRAESVSLKKFLHTRKAAGELPNLRRCLDPHWTVNQCLVLAAGEEILWIPGIGLSEKFRAHCAPVHRLRILALASDVALA